MKLFLAWIDAKAAAVAFFTAADTFSAHAPLSERLKAEKGQLKVLRTEK
jgi:hypothetical protein